MDNQILTIVLFNSIILLNIEKLSKKNTFRYMKNLTPSLTITFWDEALYVNGEKLEIRFD